MCEEYLGAEAYLIEGGSRELVPLGLGLLVLLQLLKQPTIELHCLSEPSNGGCEPAGHRESGQGTPRLRAPRHNAVPYLLRHFGLFRLRLGYALLGLLDGCTQAACFCMRRLKRRSRRLKRRI